MTSDMVAPPTPIVRRQVEIDFDPVSPGPWFPAGGPLETMFNAASISFPQTERFFIAAVRAYQDRITDPVLREQVLGFIHQEAMHNKVHIDCNAMLARDNPNVGRAERISEITFAILGRLPKAFRLSLSSALEHFTAMAADTLLHYPNEFVQIVPAEVAQMWLWHAVEETEHKAVCFDVHQAVIGTGPLSYLNRIAGMLLATPVFLVVLITMGAAALSWRRPKRPVEAEKEVDMKAHLSPSSDAARFLGRNMFGVMRELIPWRLYFSYYRPSFHPWDHDNSRFVAEWKERYPEFGLAKART
jgi:predicted metal-dependent hydrolase